MRKNLEDEILNMERIKYLTDMSVNRLLSYDKSSISDHYDEIVSIFCFLEEQMSEKFKSLHDTYYQQS